MARGVGGVSFSWWDAVCVPGASCFFSADITLLYVDMLRIRGC